jgi:hypothetical protein
MLGTLGVIGPATVSAAVADIGKVVVDAELTIDMTVLWRPAVLGWKVTTKSKLWPGEV